MSGFNASRIWAMDTETADRLVQNSTADIVTVIRITPDSSDYTLDMLFMSAGNDTRLRRTSSSLLEGLNDGLNVFVDSLSTQLAFIGGADQDLELYFRVDGVRSFSEYRTLLDQFADLEQVIFARMDRADDRGVRYLLRYQSDQALLIDSIVAITGLQLVDTTSARVERSTTSFQAITYNNRRGLVCRDPCKTRCYFLTRIRTFYPLRQRACADDGDTQTAFPVRSS